jgi:iron complex transport system substrate-binding protein
VIRWLGFVPFLLSLPALGGESPLPGAMTIEDASGVSVRVRAKPQRVVTLAPSLGELAAEVLSEDLSRLVGVSEYTDYPPALKTVASIGRYDRFNLEKVAALKPDLVLATLDGNSRDQIERLRELGLTVVVVATSDFDSIGKSMILVADSLGDHARGISMARQFEQGLERIRARGRASATHPRILLQVGTEPLVVAAGKSFLSSAIELIGARNVYADATQPYPRPSLEDAIHRDPDQIIVVALSTDDRSVEAAAKSWKRFGAIKAVREKRVRILRADSLVRPSLRLLEGLSLLEKLVRGSAG